MNGIKPKSKRATKSTRLLPLDGLRGLIIVLMALDHANSFIARGKLEPELWADLFPSYTGHSSLTFLTRSVTHLAAPGFFFLMGLGMVLFARSRRRRGWNNVQIARHFLARGSLLILLQFLLENPAWALGEVIMDTVYFGVLFALGSAMLVGILFLRLETRWLWVVSGLLIVVPGLLLPATRTGFVAHPLPLRLVLLAGFSGPMLVLYPLLPWLGVMGLGMGYGRFRHQRPTRFYHAALGGGLAAVALFLPLRWAGGFGNIRPPAEPGWIPFLNLVKYPPSLTFLLLTLGVNLLLLALFARLPPAAIRPFSVFGRVPLFFYLTHLYLYAILGQLIAPGGTGIPRMLPYWLLGLALLFPLCWWYGRFKNGRAPDSLWRFF